MKFVLEINCDNAAFADCWRTEVATILELQVLPKLVSAALDPNHITLRDGNGNTVGKAVLLVNG